jgi:hypothetical protein
MATIATARIPHRIDTSPTERIPQVLPPLPPAVTGALDWAGVDLKPAADRPGCPVWCNASEHQVDFDGSVAHFSTRQVVSVAGIVGQEGRDVTADLLLINGPDRADSLTIGLNVGQVELTPQYALQIADMLTGLAALALGVDNGPTGRSGDWWHGYAVGLGDGTGVCERAIVEAAHPVRTFVARLAARFRRGAR